MTLQLAVGSIPSACVYRSGFWVALRPGDRFPGGIVVNSWTTLRGLHFFESTRNPDRCERNNGAVKGECHLTCDSADVMAEYDGEK